MSRTCVVVFVMDGCEACEEFKPRFRRFAEQHRSQVPIYVLDANAAEHQALANRLGISATPTTCVLRNPTGVVKAEGAVPDQEIARLFQIAVAYR